MTTTSTGVLVSPDWLGENLADPTLRVIEVDVSPARFDDWHIDGAVLWNVYTDLKDADYHAIGRAAMEQLLSRSGIGQESTVVCYGYAPALGFWLLKLFGHADVRILDCSRVTWRAGGYPSSTTPSRPPIASYHLGNPEPRLRAASTDVHDAIDNPATTLLDVRSRAEYDGQRFWPSGATIGWTLPDLRDPDGHEVRFYTTTHHREPPAEGVLRVENPREASEAAAPAMPRPGQADRPSA